MANQSRVPGQECAPPISTQPDPERRTFLIQGGTLTGLVSFGLLGAPSAGVISPESLPAESGRTGIVEAFGGIPATGDQVRVTVPSTVDDGAVVPVSVESSLPDTREILIVVEKNPIPLAARVRIPEGTDAFVSMRIKVAESGDIRALVRAGGQMYTASAQTKVTVGGCS